MSWMVRRWLLFPVSVAAVVWCFVAVAESPTPQIEGIKFADLIARIRELEANDTWRKRGWKDETIDAAINKLVAAVKLATGKEFLKLSVEFPDVSAERAERRAGIEGGLLRVLKGNQEFTSAKKSILLVDGSIHISHASDCIVIARGIVEISHSNRNLIIAGHHVDISHDGSDGFRGGGRPGVADPLLKDGSIVVSGGSVVISHAHGTVCSAPTHLDIGHATQVDFLGSPNRTISHEHGCTEYKRFSLPIVIPAPLPLPVEILKVKQIVAPDDRTKQLVTVERNGIEYVLRPGAKIVDETGQPILGWTDWTVGFVTDEAVLFTDGQRDVSVHIK